MQKVPLLSISGIFLAAVALLTACGNQGLKSLTVTPPSADAKSSPNGQVQFTAMGSYAGSSQATVVKALWWNVQPWTTVPTAPTFVIDSNGMASCLGVISGTFTVWATTPTDQTLPLSKVTVNTKQLSATAQITCP